MNEPVESKLTRLGLEQGQYYDDKSMSAVMAAFWYDETCQAFGFGDIGASHVDNVAASLRQNELLAAVYWPNIQQPKNVSPKDIALNFNLMILPGVVYLPGQDGRTIEHERLGRRRTLSPESAERILTKLIKK